MSARRRLCLLVSLTTLAILLVFTIPLVVLLRTLAEDRAFTAAAGQSHAVLLAAITTGNASSAASKPGATAEEKATLRVNQIQRAVGPMIGAHEAGVTSLYLENGQELGPITPDAEVDRVRSEGRTVHRIVNGDGYFYAPAPTLQGVLVARTVIPGSLLYNGVLTASAVLAGVALVLFAAALMAATGVARRFSEPLSRIVDAADALRAGEFSARVPESGPPEVTALASALNRLATRVEALLTAERTAVADLSHRLRTPVTALRLDSEGVADPDVAERLRVHVGQLERTIDAIVHDARRPTQPDVTRSCDAVRVVGERVAFWSALAEEQGRQLRMALPERVLPARLEAAELSAVVDVLIDNVFAHTVEGVPIEVWLVQRADGMIVLTVEDGGPGLPSEDVVERGSSGAGSTGLGMDIARRAAIAAGGGLELGRSQLGGALVRVLLGPAFE